MNTKDEREKTAWPRDPCPVGSCPTGPKGVYYYVCMYTALVSPLESSTVLYVQDEAYPNEGLEKLQVNVQRTREGQKERERKKNVQKDAHTHWMVCVSMYVLYCVQGGGP